MSHNNNCSRFLSFQVIPICLIFFEHSCLPHNSVIVRDIFMQLYRNMDQVLYIRMIVPTVLVSKLCPFDQFFFK